MTEVCVMRTYLHPDGGLVNMHIHVQVPALVAAGDGAQREEFVDDALDHIDREMFISGQGVVPLLPRD
jgi:hypothetical protein